MEFAVLYKEGTGETGSFSIEFESYDVVGISRAARREKPGIQVCCIIPRKPPLPPR